MASEESETREDDTSTAPRTVTLVVLCVLSLLAIFALGSTPAMEDLSHEMNHGLAAEDYTVVEGDDIYSRLELANGTLHVEFTEPPSELGVSKLYLYENGSEVDATELGPLESRTEMYNFVAPTAESDLRLVAVDGSNRVVSEVRLDLKEVCVTDACR